ncbi:hypothetical protein SUGI_0495620 [Cryptomeria japonica]|uniref:17.6 kDa class I heat shock protein n=1 Tax=Cryptomeria japonica TaxID=3369 RepID=UPI00240898EE|nr:17.6 kDa class I heat shock protein [Cryptomeria japonica]GLJ25865.1 hypothetical protein SUGI_0495620 [Cryptomeria japonica]
MAVSQEARASGSASSSRDGQQWKEPLTEALFNSFFLPRRDVLDTFFRSGYLFDPFLFGFFMDPSEPFALWSTTPQDIWPKETVALSKSRVDWFQTDDSIILCCDLPGMKKYDINVTVENGQILKIGGVWNHRADDIEEGDGEWWKVEYMRKFLLPQNGNIEHARARMDDGVLDLRIPKLKNKTAKGASSTFKVVEVTD